MRKIKNTLMILVLSVMAISFTSCFDDEPTYYNDIFGEWQLVEDNMGPVPAHQAVKYAFYNDGTGIYGYYDKYGTWRSDNFTWDYDYSYNNSIVLRFYDGYTDRLFFDWQGYDLVLSTDYYFNNYGIYRRTR